MPQFQAVELAREIVGFIENMDQNGLYFFNSTLHTLQQLHSDMKTESENPNQGRIDR